MGTQTWKEWGRKGSRPCHELAAVFRLTLAYGFLFLQNHSGSIEEGIRENHRSSLRKCVWSPAPEREEDPERKPSPSFPAQVQHPGPRDVLSCPGNVLPGHAASTSLLPILQGWPPSLLWPRLLHGDAQPHAGDQGSTEGPAPKGKTSFSLFFGGAQLPAAAVKTEYGSDTRVKTP